MMLDDLVGLDQDGIMLYTVINGVNLPNFEPYAVDHLYSLLYNATADYLEANRIPGCTSPDAANFDFQVRATCIA